MSLESTTTIAGLVAANPTAGDPFSQGDDHLRLIKTVLKTIFPGAASAGFSIPITATEAELNFVHGVTSAIQTQLTTMAASVVPSGVICMWHGSVATIPTGWALCNGTSGTPSLIGKFILGYHGTDYPTIGATGGYEDAAVITHTHAVTTQLTALSDSHAHTGTTGGESIAHTHAYSVVTTGGTGIGGGAVNSLATTQTGAQSSGHTHAFTTSSDAHTHNVTGTIPAPAGAVAVTGRNLPPYYVLAYIMKL
jgi:hypothetical protein